MKLDFRGLNNTNKVSEGILYYVQSMEPPQLYW